MTARRVELTADVGERAGSEGHVHDEPLIELLTTAHIACGGHAGDESSMAAAIDACVRNGVRIGAHPSYLDREGFGRRSMGLDPIGVADSVVAQVVALETLAVAAGESLSSVKPHGQLYHDLSTHPALAEVVLNALRGIGVTEVVLAAGSPAAARGAELGLSIRAEGFCDRRYDPHGGLVPRTEPGAVLENPAAAAAQAVSLVTEGVVVGSVAHRIASLCVHSDSPGAAGILAAVRAALEAAAIEIAPLN